MAESEARTLARKLLRRFVRDYPELNRLLRAQEHSPEDIDLALDLTVAEWNAKNRESCKPETGSRTAVAA